MTPDEAYGERRPGMVQRIPRKHFKNQKLAVGIDVLDLVRSVPEVREDVKRSLEEPLLAGPLRQLVLEPLEALAQRRRVGPLVAGAAAAGVAARPVAPPAVES